MMRKRIIAGNWKMNKTLKEGMELASAVDQLVSQQPSDVEVIIAPPFIHLSDIKKLLSVVKLSAQNCASEAQGAYTGEVAAAMIRSTGATHVIIGHSERRTYFMEDNELLYKKVILALGNSLIPIFCCGEILAEREADNHFDVVRNQLDKTVFKLGQEDFANIIIAYEPVWAIGTGVNATPGQAQEMHAYIRMLIGERYNAEIAENITIQYGGSCKPDNARELFANPDVDGGLIGGASLKAEDFIAIVHSF
jgi:triosephosphate isomerase